MAYRKMSVKTAVAMTVVMNHLDDLSLRKAGGLPSRIRSHDGRWKIDLKLSIFLDYATLFAYDTPAVSKA
jgi:hypothetical protein